jgi:phosphoglycerol transferase
MSAIITRISVFIMAAIFAVGTLYFGFFSSPYQINGIMNEKKIAVLIAVVLFVVILFLPHKQRANAKYKTVLWFIVLLVSFPLAVTRFVFGTNELDSILIFFRDNQADDIAVIASDSFSVPISLSLVVFVLMLLTALFLLVRKQHFDNILLAVTALFIVVSPITLFVINSFSVNEMQATFDHDAEMSMKITARPDQQRNLVVIYLESLERSYVDIDATQRAYAPINDLARQSVEAVNLQQVFGTTYTIAGIVASQCGVPLISSGLGDIFFRKRTTVSLEALMPSVTCLGDVLRDDGYTLSYLNGADLNRFSKRGFLKSHGYTRLLGSGDVAPEIMEGRSNAFGMNDALLFGYVYDEYDHLSTQAAPFAMSMLTIATHGPDAFLDNECSSDNQTSKMPAAIACTAKHLQNFISYVRANPAARDTDIVVLSDHLALPNTLETALKAKGDQRRDLFFINSGADAQVIERPATMLDIYPTILEHLGYGLRDGQANLGRSMFNATPNLLERFGVDDVDRLFKGNQTLAKHLWREQPE